MNKLINGSSYCALTIIGMIFIPVLLFIILLISGFSSEIKWQIPFAAFFITPIVMLVFVDDIKAKIYSLISISLIFIISFYCASLFYDNTWDSRAYHADGILLLLNGNNPFYEKMVGFDDLWTNHYPKLTWYFASIIIHFTDNFNLGKVFNPLLAFATICYVFSFLKTREFSSIDSLLLGVAAAINPVFVSQL
ncbi:MAG: hypothetical protein WCJ33_08725, partial [Pseudomonadota bacterium]